MKIFISAGEHSGDMHGSELARAIRSIAPDAVMRGLGGPLMSDAGVELLVDTTAGTVMGLTEVVEHIPRHIRLLGRAAREILTWRPDIVVPIDYPDFNLRLARKVHGGGIPVVYYVGPQVWAWRAGRVEQIRRYVRKMLVIFPFEEEFYRKHDINVEFVGHPLLDRIESNPPKTNLREKFCPDEDSPLIGILPGSRTSVYSRHWPVVWEAARAIREKRPDACFVVALAGGVNKSAVVESRLCAPERNFFFYNKGGSDVIASADALLVTSGTATVEAAIHGTPMAVFYKVSGLSFALARRLVKVSEIAMCNLIAGKPVVKEFIQSNATPANLAGGVLELLDGETRETQKRELAAVRERLGNPGASLRAAKALLGCAD